MHLRRHTYSFSLLWFLIISTNCWRWHNNAFLWSLYYSKFSINFPSLWQWFLVQIYWLIQWQIYHFLMFLLCGDIAEISFNFSYLIFKILFWPTIIYFYTFNFLVLILLLPNQLYNLNVNLILFKSQSLKIWLDQLPFFSHPNCLLSFVDFLLDTFNLNLYPSGISYPLILCFRCNR